MDQNVDPMVQRNRLRVRLQDARQRLQLTQVQVAQDLGWSVSKLLRIENGKVGVSRTDLKAILQRYGITDQMETAELIRTAEQGRRQRWSAYRDVLNPKFFEYLEYEGSATSIRQFQPHVIPGLLQTEAYTRALDRLVAPDTAPETLDRRIEVRLHRHRLLDKPDMARLHFILDEAAVRRWAWREPGTAAIMREQLAHLKTLSGRTAITIQVMSLESGPYQGMSVPFILLGFPHAEDNDLLFLENGMDSVTSRSDATKISKFAALFEELAARATPSGELADFLDQVAAEEEISGDP